MLKTECGISAEQEAIKGAGWLAKMGYKTNKNN
jgi:hypothetical protein